MYCDWCIRTLPTRPDAVGGGGSDDAVALLLRKLEPPTRKLVVSKWVEDYQLVMNKFADMLEKPHWQARVAVKEEEQNIVEEMSVFKALKNPLILYMMPSSPTVADIFATHQAKLDMCRIICAAALVNARTGRYPQSITELGEFFPQGFPVDPFTGKDYTYRLEDGMPYVQCNAPEDLWERNSRRYQLSLSKGIQEDADALKKHKFKQE